MLFSVFTHSRIIATFTISLLLHLLTVSLLLYEYFYYFPLGTMAALSQPVINQDIMHEPVVFHTFDFHVFTVSVPFSSHRILLSTHISSFMYMLNVLKLFRIIEFWCIAVRSFCVALVQQLSYPWRHLRYYSVTRKDSSVDTQLPRSADNVPCGSLDWTGGGCGIENYNPCRLWHWRRLS